MGPVTANRLRHIDILEPSDLIGRDPYALFDELTARTGVRHDPCLLDVLVAVTAFMSGEPARPWWHYTAERKAALATVRLEGSSAEKRSFAAPIERASGGGAYVTVPFDVESIFGKKRVPVIATIDGVPYRGSLVRMGTQCHVLGVLKEIREQIGKDVGDVVDIVIEEDARPRVVEVPHDLATALASHPEASEGFEQLSFSHRREYVRWIEEAKRSDTRASRIAEAVDMLSRGEKLR